MSDQFYPIPLEEIREILLGAKLYLDTIKKYIPVHASAAEALLANPIPVHGAIFHNPTTDTVWMYYGDFDELGRPIPGSGEFNDEGEKLESPVYWSNVWADVVKICGIESLNLVSQENMNLTSRSIMYLKSFQDINIEPFGNLFLLNIPSYANDAAAGAINPATSQPYVPVGAMYFDTTKGAYTKRTEL